MLRIIVVVIGVATLVATHPSHFRTFASLHQGPFRGQFHQLAPNRMNAIKTPSKVMSWHRATTISPNGNTWRQPRRLGIDGTAWQELASLSTNGTAFIKCHLFCHMIGTGIGWHNFHQSKNNKWHQRPHMASQGADLHHIRPVASHGINLTQWQHSHHMASISRYGIDWQQLY